MAASKTRRRSAARSGADGDSWVCMMRIPSLIASCLHLLLVSVVCGHAGGRGGGGSTGEPRLTDDTGPWVQFHR